MKFFALTALAMCAFAANSLINRAGLTGGDIGPAGFAFIRLAAGAVTLVILLKLRRQGARSLARPNIPAIFGLTTYMLGFSFAYVALDAGTGALLLFGTVQATMFLGAVASGQRIQPRRWLGMGISLSGLFVLVAPSASTTMPPIAVALMVSAAIGWGIYSLVGTKTSESEAPDPMRTTATTFVYALGLALVICVPFAVNEPLGARGILTAITSGAVTSGLGYALWYRLLPQLGATTAALSQLTVPVIALAAAGVFLGETISTQAVLASALICGGVAIALAQRNRA